MARKPLKSTSQIPSPGVKNDGRLKRMILAKVTSDGKIDQFSLSAGSLLLNPESVEDVKISNWIANQIPGQSDPIYQWVSGGPRTLSFEALVTKDTAEFLNPQDDPLAGLIDSAINAIGSIASSFIGINLPPLGDLFSSVSEDAEGNELSIEEQLNYYRSLNYPNYVEGRLETSPPLLAIMSGSMLSTVNTHPGAMAISEDTDLWVLTELRIRETKFLSNLAPMEALVSFRFNQYTVKSFGADHFSQEVKEADTQKPTGILATLGGYIT